MFRNARILERNLVSINCLALLTLGGRRLVAARRWRSVDLVVDHFPYLLLLSILLV
jgi:hypothetical protein